MRRMPELKVTVVSTSDLVPYANNTKLHTEEQIEQIMASIRDFGNCDPIAVWHNADGQMEIIEGHGRLMALKRLGIDKAPVITLDHLTDEERRAYGIVHNATNMSTGFDMVQLQKELDGISSIDMSQFDLDIDVGGDWFAERDRNDTSRQDGNDDYNEFLDKFEAKKTIDDCYTPDIVYDAVADWVADAYGVERENFVRPFYPNGDYQREKYGANDVVVDNPPFSILTEILRFYVQRGIRFFLFAPTLTLFTGRGLDICYLPVGVGVTYENGASVNTSFITNMEDEYRIHVIPSLYDAVKDANDRNLKETRRELPKYEFPSHVVTAAGLSRYAVHGVEFTVRPDECQRISALDSMKEVGKALFGGGFLLSDGAAARNELADAEKEENKRQAEIERMENAIHGGTVEVGAGGTFVWSISERERRIIKGLGGEDR